MSRFFIHKEDIHGETLRTQDNTHHILHVLRYEPGDVLTFCDGEGTDYLCRIEEISTEGRQEWLEAAVLSREPSATEPAVWMTLFQGIPKADKMEWIIEKSVELGVSEIVPVAMARSVSRPDGAKLASKVQRWNKISLSAAEQSGRGRIPQVRMPVSSAELAGELADYDLVIICYEDARLNSLRQILSKAVMQNGMPHRVAVIIGPEGGLESDEVDLWQRSGGLIAGLGPRILRTETAGTVAAALIFYELNQM